MPTDPPLPTGSTPPTGIASRQNEPAHLRLLHAKKYRHDVADRWANLNVAGTIGFAVLVPVIAMVWPGSAAWLSAAAAGWLVLGRSLFRRFEQTSAELGIRYQEQFETSVFALPWNTALANEPPRTDAIVDDARRARHVDDQRDWFADDGATPKPVDILLAHLESALWGRRNHHLYARWLSILAAAIATAGILVAVIAGLSVTDYLIRLLFPSLPALQEALFLADEHRKTASAKAQLENQIIQLLERLEAGGHVTQADCRSLQDATYTVRRGSPSMPTWFFRARHKIDSNAIQGTLTDWRNRLRRTTPSG